MLSGTPAPIRVRFLASLGDLAVIGGWIGLLSGAGAVARRFLPATPPDAAGALVAVDLGVFAATVLPAGLYLALGEAAPRQASWGKRWAGLQVVDRYGHPPGSGRVMVRTAVKLLPWQLAHLAVARLILGVDQPATVGITYAASVAVPVASIGLAITDPARRALHDRLAGTCVIVRVADQGS